MFRVATRKMMTGLRTLSQGAGKEGAEPPIINTSLLAVAGVGVGALFLGLDAAKKRRDGEQYFEVSDYVELESEAAVKKFRSDMLVEGMKEAGRGAALWGGTATLILTALRYAEYPLFKSNALRSAGTPRLAFGVGMMAMCGFAIKGETTLIRAARTPARVKRDA
mmetsp:Transcript_55224/g.135217  ORF Transcript_55224/g.135217 Transcript_55224/m.135217 type:complete len:165 (+) Transcript_55224:94-588(+)